MEEDWGLDGIEFLPAVELSVFDKPLREVTYADCVAVDALLRRTRDAYLTLECGNGQIFYAVKPMPIWRKM